MKKLIKSTTVVKNALDRLRMERMVGVSITDKAMTELSVERVENIKAMHLFEVDTDDGYIQQVIIEDVNGAHSSSSKVLISLVDELIDIVNNGEASLTDITIDFEYGNSGTGNKYLNAILR